MTAPLTPPDCDLRDFPFMPLDAGRLFGSEFHAIASDSEWRAGVCLWLKSWHQVPAASLPNDDTMLCRLAEFGRDMRSWRKVRAVALRGWVLCDDGRLYHETVAQKAVEAWERKQAFRKRTEKARQARLGRRDDDDKQPVTIPVTEPVDGSVTATTGTGTGTGTGIGTDSSVPNGTGAVAPIDPDKKAWQEGVDLLKSHGVGDKPARQFIGKLVKDSGGEARALLPIIAKCIEIGTQDPRSYLTKAVQALADRRSGGSPPPPSPDEPINWAWRLEQYRGRDRVWIESMWGPPPGKPGCQCPPELLEAV